MPKIFTSATQKTGELAENIATRFLMKLGYAIIERNYTQKWGEIDIVARKAGVLHFVEVKSVARETLAEIDLLLSRPDQYRPEDNMHPWKQKRLARAIQTYLASKSLPEDQAWQFDLLVVFLALKDKKARVKVLSNIIL